MPFLTNLQIFFNNIYTLQQLAQYFYYYKFDPSYHFCIAKIRIIYSKNRRIENYNLIVKDCNKIVLQKHKYYTL